MAYTTVQTVRDTTGMSNTTNIPDAFITSKIAFAGGIIDGKIGQRYQLPLGSTPELIGMIALEMAVTLLYLGQYGEEAQDTDKGWEKRWNALLKQLDDIRDGKTQLFDASGEELPRKATLLPSFYPTDASSLPEASDSTQPKITMNKKY